MYKKAAKRRTLRRSEGGTVKEQDDKKREVMTEEGQKSAFHSLQVVHNSGKTFNIKQTMLNAFTAHSYVLELSL